MKLASYELDGRAGFGALVGDSLVPLATLLGGGIEALARITDEGALSDIRSFIRSSAQRIPLSAVRFLPVNPSPRKIFCVGVNYGEHMRETQRSPTAHPIIFLRLASSQIGHGRPIVKPAVSDELDFEGEIAVVVRKGGRAIEQAHALDHVLGYSCYNDVTVRDWQRHTSQWTAGKNFDGTGAFGPWLTTPDEMPAADAISLTTRLNGQIVQHAVSDAMIFSIAEQIAYLSTFSTLEPGDVIVTGTPGGVGAKRTPPLFMKPGDVIEVEVGGVGTLSNPIVAE